jgi:hypothetical protein
MKFYVSGPVVDELRDKDPLARLYVLIEKLLKGHRVELPLRTRDLETLSAGAFYQEVFKMISSSDGVICVLMEGDQSGPVESTIASLNGKPQCIMEISAAAPRLLRGLSNVIDVRKLEMGTVLMEGEVRASIQALLKHLGASLP